MPRVRRSLEINGSWSKIDSQDLTDTSIQASPQSRALVKATSRKGGVRGRGALMLDTYTRTATRTHSPRKCSTWPLKMCCSVLQCVEGYSVLPCVNFGAVTGFLWACFKWPYMHIFIIVTQVLFKALTRSRAWVFANRPCRNLSSASLRFARMAGKCGGGGAGERLEWNATIFHWFQTTWRWRVYMY